MVYFKQPELQAFPCFNTAKLIKLVCGINDFKAPPACLFLQTLITAVTKQSFFFLLEVFHNI